MAKYNAGYEIIEALSFSNHHFVLGHSPKAPAAYVTWETNEKQDAFFRGHYFTEKEDALLDLFQRAGKELHLESRMSLGMALLTDQDRHDLRQEFRNENARDDIAAALAEEMDCNRDKPYNQEALLNDPDFMVKAIRAYDNLDHSYENEALRDELSYILTEFPQHRIAPVPESLTAEVRIAPEMNDLLKDLLSMPTTAVAEEYGPLGDNYEFVFDFDNGAQAILSLRPGYDPNHPNNLSAENPHYMFLEAYDEYGSTICAEALTEGDWNPDPEKGGVAGKYHIYIDEDHTLTLDLQEDESLRRTGNHFIYQPNTEDKRYQEHAGDICTILRPLTPKEADILCTGLMWEAEFPNGDVLNIFDGELSLPEKNLSRKAPLSQQISSAQEKNNPHSLNQDQKEPER